VVRAYGFVGILLLAIFGSIGGYQYKRITALANADFTPPPVTIAAEQAKLEIRRSMLEAVGTIKAVRGVELTSETSGEVTNINFTSGDAIVAGEELVVLNDEVEQAARRNQIASLDLAKVLFERDQKLISQKSIPESQYDRSKADLERAKAALAETEARIRNKRISAPFNGTIGIRRIDAGDYVSPGTRIATLQDLSELEIDFTLPARHAPQLQPGLMLTLKVGAFPDRTFPATLLALDSRVDPDTMNILARARIDDSEGLLPGMFAAISISLASEYETVTVPETAITYSIQGSTVWVIQENQNGLTVSPRVIKIGKVEGGRAAIIAGLAAEEQVVIAGQHKLYREATVEINNSVKL
jgi:membrane fusion protein, multidrug efflux system